MRYKEIVMIYIINLVIMIFLLGDYAATRTSLIGALKHNLDLSVRDLAKDKAEDLRRYFHCWWSKPLAAYLPYR